MNNKLIVNQEQIIDINNILDGVYAPLTGFLKKRDFLSVVSKMKLANGQIWPIPIVLDVNQGDALRLNSASEVILVNHQGQPLALLKEIEIYQYNKDFLAKNVFQTLDKAHPGVEGVYQMGDYLIGGEIERINSLPLSNTSGFLFDKYYLPPKETKKIFQENDWRTVVAFQTRNVPHRSHEALQKHALYYVDGLFIQPVIGKKKSGDFKDEVILQSYDVLIDKYYPKNRVQLGILPLKMRYAGPREAVFHALIRRNFGCTHMIIGRDHAGVGNYYHPYAAHDIFDQFLPEEIGINILKYDHSIYCRLCDDFVSQKVCPHSDEDKVFLSGTKVRELIQSKQSLPEKMVRSEIVDLLLNHPNPFIE